MGVSVAFAREGDSVFHLLKPRDYAGRHGVPCPYENHFYCSRRSLDRARLVTVRSPIVDITLLRVVVIGFCSGHPLGTTLLRAEVTRLNRKSDRFLPKSTVGKRPAFSSTSWSTQSSTLRAVRTEGVYSLRQTPTTNISGGHGVPCPYRSTVLLGHPPW